MKVNKRLTGDRCRERGGLNFPVWHGGEMRILGWEDIREGIMMWPKR